MFIAWEDFTKKEITDAVHHHTHTYTHIHIHTHTHTHTHTHPEHVQNMNTKTM